MKQGESVAQIAAGVGLSKGRTRRIMKADGYIPKTGGARFAFASDADRRRAEGAYATLAELGRPLTVLRAIERSHPKPVAK